MVFSICRRFDRLPSLLIAAFPRPKTAIFACVVQIAKAVGIHSHMHKTKVSRAVALLERRKLVTRRANRDDLREAFLSLAPAGRDIYSELAPIALDFVHQLMDNLDADDRAALDRALKKLTDRSAQLVPEIAKGGDPR